MATSCSLLVPLHRSTALTPPLAISTVRERLFAMTFCTNRRIFLPRQARDQYRKCCKDCLFVQVARSGSRTLTFQVQKQTATFCDANNFLMKNYRFPRQPRAKQTVVGNSPQLRTEAFPPQVLTARGLTFSAGVWERRARCCQPTFTARCEKRHLF
jgi:hypothetical protein